MNIFIFLIIITTIAQLIFCHFSLWWFISMICRLLFCCRIIGATFKVRKLVVGEGAAFGCLLLWSILFGGKPFPWLRVLLYLLLSLVSIALMLLDDILYVYVIEDVEE